MKFIIRRREVWIQDVEVEANSREKALTEHFAGRYKILDGQKEFSHVMNLNVDMVEEAPLATQAGAGVGTMTGIKVEKLSTKPLTPGQLQHAFWDVILCTPRSMSRGEIEEQFRRAMGQLDEEETILEALDDDDNGHQE